MKINISRIWKKAQSSRSLTNEKLSENPISTLALTDEDLATVDGACLGGFGGFGGFGGYGLGYGCNEGFGGYGFGSGFGGYGCNEGFGGYGFGSGYGFRGCGY